MAAICLQLQEWADYWRQQGYTEEQVAEWLAETVAAAAAPAEAAADGACQADPAAAAAADATAEQGVDPEALQTAVATAQWVDTTAAPAAEAAYGDAPLAAPVEPDMLEQEQQPGDLQPPVDQTPMPAPHPQHQQTPGTGATEYYTPGAEGGEATEQAAQAAARGVPGQLGHVVSLGAAWLKQRASSHASDTTGGQPQDRVLSHLNLFMAQLFSRIMQKSSSSHRCSAGKITGPLPWEDAEEAGSPGSVRSPGLMQLLAPRHPHQQPAEQDPHSVMEQPLQENGAADWTEGPPAPDACG